MWPIKLGYAYNMTPTTPRSTCLSAQSAPTAVPDGAGTLSDARAGRSQRRRAPEGAAKRRIGGCAPGDGAAVPEAAAKKRRVGDAGAPDTDVARVALEASEGE